MPSRLSVEDLPVEKAMRLFLRDARKIRELRKRNPKTQHDRKERRRLMDLQAIRRRLFLRWLETEKMGPATAWSLGISIMPVPECKELRQILQAVAKHDRCGCGECLEFRQRFWTVPRHINNEGSQSARYAASRAIRA